MIFTQTQITEMLNILKRYELAFIGTQLGVNWLSASDIALLKLHGIDVNQFKNKQGIIEHAFLFGILAEAIGDKRAKKMNYAQFQTFLKSGNFIPLTEEEEFALSQMKNRAYNDITNLGARMRNVVSNGVVRSNQQQAAVVANMIRNKVVDAVKMRKTATQLAATLAETSKDWEVDWLRISYYLMHEAYNTGRAQGILKNHGPNAEVYFDVYEGACKECKELYLTDPDDIHSEPIIFTIDEIIKNGNNIGRKKDQWKATISPVHPYCRCTINYKNPNMDWDAEMRAFLKPKKKKLTNPKFKNVDVSTLIKVTKS